MENQQYAQEDEINLREYINVAIKRKKLILSIFFVSVIVSVIISLLMPKVYEVTSTIQLGSIKELLIGKEEAKEIILNQNSLAAVIKELDLKTEVNSLKKDINIKDVKGADLLTIKVTYPGLDMVLKINEAIISPLIAKGQSIYQGRLIIINERLKELNTEIENGEKNANRPQASVPGLPNYGNAAQSDASSKIIFLQNTLPDYGSNLNVFRNQRNELKLLLAGAKDFRVFDQPVKPKKPIRPKKALNILAAGITGLMFGMFLAFFLELLQKEKDEKTSRAQTRSF